MPKLPSLSLRSLHNRVLLAVVLLIALIQGGVFAVIATVGAHSVRDSVKSGVAIGAKAFERFLDLDTQRMAEGMRVLAADSHFRELITANDRAELTPMLAKTGKASARLSPC